ncbi:hypothetical protein vseg_016148 [Gypsophila vaccaria]
MESPLKGASISQKLSTKKDVGKAEDMKRPKDEQHEKTPTSEENRIPAPQSPPPAPRKRQRVALKCVRKLEFSERRITIIPADQAVQEFFNSSSVDQISSIKVFKRSASLAFDRLNSSNLTFAQKII